MQINVSGILNSTYVLHICLQAVVTSGIFLNAGSGRNRDYKAHLTFTYNCIYMRHILSTFSAHIRAANISMFYGKTWSILQTVWLNSSNME